MHWSCYFILLALIVPFEFKIYFYTSRCKLKSCFIWAFTVFPEKETCNSISLMEQERNRITLVMHFGSVVPLKHPSKSCLIELRGDLRPLLRMYLEQQDAELWKRKGRQCERTHLTTSHYPVRDSVIWIRQQTDLQTDRISGSFILMVWTPCSTLCLSLHITLDTKRGKSERTWSRLYFWTANFCSIQ